MGHFSAPSQLLKPSFTVAKIITDNPANKVTLRRKLFSPLKALSPLTNLLLTSSQTTMMKPMRQSPHKIVPGEQLLCNWPGCTKAVEPRHRGDINQHLAMCFGQNLAPLSTGLKCEIKDCGCHNVDFPTLERLQLHQKFVSTHRSLKKCDYSVCAPGGCGKEFKRLRYHFVHVYLAANQEQTITNFPRWQSFRSKDPG